jgi:hypothetical protein
MGIHPFALRRSAILVVIVLISAVEIRRAFVFVWVTVL